MSVRKSGRLTQLWLEVGGLVGGFLLILVLGISKSGGFRVTYVPGYTTAQLTWLQDTALNHWDLPPTLYQPQNEMGSHPEAVEGACSWGVRFISHANEISMVYQELQLYESETAAQAAFIRQRDQYLPSNILGWHPYPGVQFQAQADESQVVCTGASQPPHACTSISRYGRLVVLILGNTSYKGGVTIDEFRELLIVADRRAAAAMPTAP